MIKISEQLKDNTFGFELEFGDADKSKIALPRGYAWTDNDLSRMHNSDGTAVTHSGNYGGEINTRPFKHTEEDLQELNDFIQSLRTAGGYLMWNEGFDAHFYVKNLELDVIKRMFELSYWVAPYVKRIFKLAEWFENKYIAPSPTYSYVEKMNRVQSIEEIPAIFANSSHRGHIRFYLNFVPIERIGTVEFRIFQSSWNWEETYETIKFMYNFTQYVIDNPDASKYKELDSVEKCLEAFKVNPDLIPAPTPPLLWANEHTDNTTIIGESFNKNRAMMSKLVETSKHYDTVHVVNSHYLDIEQVLTGKVIVYTKNLFIWALYKIIKDDLKFKLDAPFEFIDMESGDKSERVAKLFLFAEVKRYKSDDFYHRLKFNDFKNRFDGYVTRYKAQADSILANLEGKDISVEIGDLYDCASNYTDNDLIIYQSEFNQKMRSVSNALRLYASDEFGDYTPRTTDYGNFEIEKFNYLVISKNSLLSLRKIFRNNRVFLYSNCESVKPVNRFEGRPLEPVYYKKLPDGYEMTKDSELVFVRAKMSEIDYLRMMYMKKDILLGSAVFNYLWFLDGYLIGACMFDFSKQSVAGGDKVWMKSDFVIDSDFDKLSKLLIMSTLSTEFRDELIVKYKTNVETITTTVFTNAPVSMKYRGVYDLAKRENGKLYYDQTAGKLGTLKEIVNTFITKYRKKK